MRFKTVEILLARNTGGPVAAQKCWRKQTTIATNRDRVAHFFGFPSSHHARIEPLLSDPAPLQQFYARLTIFQAEMETMDTERIG